MIWEHQQNKVLVIQDKPDYLIPFHFGHCVWSVCSVSWKCNAECLDSQETPVHSHPLYPQSPWIITSLPHTAVAIGNPFTPHGHLKRCWCVWIHHALCLKWYSDLGEKFGFGTYLILVFCLRRKNVCVRGQRAFFYLLQNYWNYMKYNLQQHAFITSLFILLWWDFIWLAEQFPHSFWFCVGRSSSTVHPEFY